MSAKLNSFVISAALRMKSNVNASSSSHNLSLVVSTKWSAPNFFASDSLFVKWLNAQTSAPTAFAHRTPKCPSLTPTCDRGRQPSAHHGHGGDGGDEPDGGRGLFMRADVVCVAASGHEVASLVGYEALYLSACVKTDSLCTRCLSIPKRVHTTGR